MEYNKAANLPMNISGECVIHSEQFTIDEKFTIVDERLDKKFCLMDSKGNPIYYNQIFRININIKNSNFSIFVCGDIDYQDYQYQDLLYLNCDNTYLYKLKDNVLKRIDNNCGGHFTITCLNVIKDTKNKYILSLNRYNPTFDYSSDVSNVLDNEGEFKFIRGFKTLCSGIPHDSNYLIMINNGPYSKRDEPEYYDVVDNETFDSIIEKKQNIKITKVRYHQTLGIPYFRKDDDNTDDLMCYICLKNQNGQYNIISMENGFKKLLLDMWADELLYVENGDDDRRIGYLKAKCGEHNYIIFYNYIFDASEIYVVGGYNFHRDMCVLGNDNKYHFFKVSYGSNNDIVHVDKYATYQNHNWHNYDKRLKEYLESNSPLDTFDNVYGINDDHIIIQKGEKYGIFVNIDFDRGQIINTLTESWKDDNSYLGWFDDIKFEYDENGNVVIILKDGNRVITIDYAIRRIINMKTVDGDDGRK